MVCAVCSHEKLYTGTLRLFESNSAKVFLKSIPNPNDKVCAPDKIFEDGSCFTLGGLVEMAKAYNIDNPNNQIKLNQSLKQNSIYSYNSFYCYTYFYFLYSLSLYFYIFLLSLFILLSIYSFVFKSP